MAHCGKKSCFWEERRLQRRLKEMASKMCEERSAKSFCPENQFLVDNGGMIAWLGLVEFQVGNSTPIAEADIDPYERTDDVSVNWR
jgi:tRNA A37 threonylcarbamoyltransferase TsaD